MNKPRTLRITLFKLHAWTGLNLSLILFLILFSGSLLLFGTEIEALFSPQMRPTDSAATDKVTAGQIYSSVRAAYPDVQINAITLRGGGFLADSTFAVTRWGEQIDIWTDPATAAVLGTTPVNGFRAFIHAFHVSFLLKMKLGDLAVLSFSILLFFMVVSGLLTYRRFWKGLFRWPAGPAGSRTWWGGMHRLVAVWTAPFLLIASISAFYFLPGHFGLRPAPLAPAQAEARATLLPAGFDGTRLDDMAAAASAAVGGMDVTHIRLPPQRNRGAEISGQMHHAAFEGGTALVMVDPSNLAVLGAYPAATAPTGRKVARIFQSLHYGTWAEGISRPLWLVFGLSSTAVALSGVYVFAARVAPRPHEPPKGPPLRRAWSGMTALKWVIVIALLGSLGLWTYRFGDVFNTGWTRVYARVPGNVGQLMISSPPEAGAPLSLRLRLTGTDAAEAQLSFEGTPVAPDVRETETGAVLTATVTATGDRNRVTAVLPGDAGQSLVWTIGRPID